MHTRTVLFLLLTCAACATDTRPVDIATERSAVERTITTWFDSALAKQDTAATRQALADDFAILEDSVWYDRDDFVRLVGGIAATVGGPFTLKYELTDWRTSVEGTVAWTSLTNRAVFTPAGGAPVPLAWRETAVLRKSNRRWSIVRYHSAPIPAPPASARP